MNKEEFVEMMEALPISAGFIETIAVSQCFLVRQGSISPMDFLYALCCLSIEGTVSFNDMAAKIEAETAVSVSRQAIAKKMGKVACTAFLKKILALCIVGRIGRNGIDQLRNGGKFKRILVQDSTIIKLPAILFQLYSGVSNGSTSVCNARVQCVYDLVSESFVSFDIDPYSINDLTAAPKLELQQGDLVLRDRGYLSAGEIERHLLSEADCIFRYKQGMILLDPVTGQRIDLLDRLKRLGQVDMTVILNDKAGTKVRIVAFPVSEELASIRRMKAKKENKKKPDTAYLEMLSWSVYITTISSQTAGYDFIYKAYSIRWRIEIIFKSWKSSMGFSKIHTVSQNQLLIILYARFIMIIICIQYIFSPARKIILNKMKKELSMLKVVRYLMKNPAKILKLINVINHNPKQQGNQLQALARYCSYEKRKRTNFESDFDAILWP